MSAAATRASRDGDVLASSKRASTAQSAPSHASTSGSSRHAASTSLAAPTSAATRRTHSFLGADDRVVLDIGASVLRAGCSGEARPRIVVSSLDQASTAEERGRESLKSTKGKERDVGDEDALWSLDLARCRSVEDRERAMSRLKAKLTRLLRKTIYESLATDPKQRKIIICENTFLPNTIRDTVQEILFRNLQVAAISFVPSNLMTAVSIGRSCALTIDIGAEQTTLVPIYYWRPLVPRFVASTTRAARRVKGRLRALLLHFGAFQPSLTPSASTASSSVLTGDTTKIKTNHLSSAFLDELIAKSLVVGSPTDDTRTGDDIHQSRLRAPGLEGEAWKTLEPFSRFKEEDDVEFMEQVQARYSKLPSSVKDMAISIPAPSHPPLLPPSQPSTLGTHTGTIPKSPGTIVIPGWIRERALEVLFEAGDSDEPSLVETILDVTLKLPVDVRPLMIGNVYISGGLVMLPGLAHRVRLELVRTLQRAGREHGAFAMHDLALTLPRVGLRQKPNGNLRKRGADTQAQASEGGGTPLVTIEQAEAGEDSFVSARAEDGAEEETFQSAASQDTLHAQAPIQSDATRQAVNKRAHAWYLRYGPISQLASDVAVINDHAPRLDAEGQAIGGRPPAFAPNLASWIGASLVGSLRIESLDSTTREAWEAAHAPRDTSREEPSPTSPSREQASMMAMAGLLSPQRPGPRPHGHRPSLGSGRGSFLGSVGGLDLGSYGPLSDGAHGTFAGNPELRSPTRRP